MGKGVVLERMQMRLKPPRIGDVVLVKNSEVYFYLPEGLPDRSNAVLVGREPGRYIVEAFGRKWNIPMQCVEHEVEMFLGGRWLDKWDRRVRRVQALLDRAHALERRKKLRKSRVHGLEANTSVNPHGSQVCF